MGNVAIVTGAAGTLGRGIVKRLRDAGWRVAAWDVDPIPDAGSDVLRLEMDVRDEASIADAAHRTLAWGGRLDGLVNNAGIADPTNARLRQLELAEWERVLATNLTGPLLCAKHCAEALTTASGAIVNVTSTRAHMAEPNTEAYMASKGGLLSLTRALAVSLGPNIRVNALSPGWIASADADLRDVDHAQHPAGRVGRPADAADAVLYLLTAGFVTGTELIVDGGMTRRMIYVD